MEKDLVVVQWIAPDGKYRLMLVDNNSVDWESDDLDAASKASGAGTTIQEAYDQMQQEVGQDVQMMDLRVVHRDGTDLGELAKAVDPDPGPLT